MSDREKEVLEKIVKKTQDHRYDPTNFQCNKILKLLRERLSVFIPKDIFIKNEEYMYVMLKEIIYMTMNFVAENKEVGDE